MKEETREYISELVEEGLTNPSGIVSCIFSKGLETQPYGLLRSRVIKELDRIKKRRMKK